MNLGRFPRVRFAQLPTDHDYTQSGKLLDRLHGASIEPRPATADMNAELLQVAAKLEESGRKPYIIPRCGLESRRSGVPLLGIGVRARNRTSCRSIRLEERSNVPQHQDPVQL